MTRSEIAQVLNEYAEAKNRNDVDSIIGLLADDAFYENAGFGQRVEGPEALRAYYMALFEAIPGYFGEFDGTAYGNDSAVVWGRFGGTLGNEFMGAVVEAGRRIEVPVTFVCTFRDGLLVGDTGYFDPAALAEQIGVPLELIRGQTQRNYVRSVSKLWAWQLQSPAIELSENAQRRRPRR